MPKNMCGNLQWSKYATGLGIVSGEYKPDGRHPAVNATAAIPKPISSASSAAATSTPTGTQTPKSTGSSIRIAVSTMVLAAISLGLAMI
ncbi:hypothetical protein BGZ59_009334 [Podila verticillata]|nr:hypothetical protein BGZ59_009334 [Podila verticillata]